MPTRPSSAPGLLPWSGPGEEQKQTATELGIRPVTLSKRVERDRIDRGEISGVSTTESADLRAARRRIHEVETEVLIIRQAARFSVAGS